MKFQKSDKKQIIWYISKYFIPKNIGSVGNRGWYLLKEFNKKGYGTIAITSNSNNLATFPHFPKKVTRESVENIEVIWLRTIKYLKAKSLMRILSWIHFEWNLFWFSKKELPQPDYIIVSSLSLLTIINGLILKRRFKCKLIFEIRDIWPLTLVEEGNFSSNNPLVLLLGLIEKIGYKYSDLIVGTMPNLADHVKSVSSTDTPIACVPMGFSPSDMDNLKEPDNKFINKYLNPNYFNVVYAGTLGITNSLDTYFKIAKEMESFKKIKFILIGDGSLKEEYKNKYCDYKNIIFAPKIPKDFVVKTLQCSDILYLSFHNSKIWDFGQSVNKLIDYMLSGRPIICSFNGYMTMINEAQCGVIIDANDHLRAANEIKSLFCLEMHQRDEIGLRGKEWILQNRSYKDLAEHYLSEIGSL